MLDKGFIDQRTYDKALAEEVVVHQGENEFLLQAPYFTEHIRRIWSTRTASTRSTTTASRRLDVRSRAPEGRQQAGRRRRDRADHTSAGAGPLEHVADSAIPTKAGEIEKALKEAESHRRTALRRADERPRRIRSPALRGRRSSRRRYDAVVVDVAEKHAVVAIGAHQAIIPLSWTDVGLRAEPEAELQGSRADRHEQRPEEGRRDPGHARSGGRARLEKFAGYDAMPSGPLAAAKLYQAPELEGAMLSYRSRRRGARDGRRGRLRELRVQPRDAGEASGRVHVQAHRVRGRDRDRACSRRARSSRTRRRSTTSLDGELWKPDNYGNEYLGNITLRRALQQSRNVCTIRVLDKLGLDPVFNLAGPTPAHRLRPARVHAYAHQGIRGVRRAPAVNRP
jgi:hypothetical protein